MKGFVKTIAAVVAGATLVSAGAAIAQDRTGWPRALTVGTASQGGTYFVYGNGLAAYIGETFGITASGEVTGGPVQNATLVQMKEHGIGLVTMGPMYDAWNGKSELAPGLPHTDVRALFPMYQTPFQCITMASSGIKAVSDLNGKRVLVLCQGGGTSGLLANALAKAAKERGINLETAAEAYGNHVDMLPDFDLVVLAPQAASYLADLQKDCERVGNKCVACRGKQYIELSQNGDKSLAFVSEQLSK